MQTWVAGLVTDAITILELFSLDEPPQGILTEKKSNFIRNYNSFLNRIQFDKGINFKEKNVECLMEHFWDMLASF